jgi:type II restriction enzyme
MGVNLDKPHLWKLDVATSVDQYNNWFLGNAPPAFRSTRVETTKSVEEALEATDLMRDISASLLEANPSVLPMLRMACCPPLARDRLIGLTGVDANLVVTMEDKKALPPRMNLAKLRGSLEKIGSLIERLADPDIFVWLRRDEDATPQEVHRAASIVADRLCLSMANPIIKNEQERRQLAEIKRWLEDPTRGYRFIPSGSKATFDNMAPGTFSFHMNVPCTLGEDKKVNVSIDAVVQPRNSRRGDLPVFIEAKSAGDFTNTNKRRKEEAKKISQLRETLGPNIVYVLFLCGYFDSGYLGYEASEGIDWVWEHRVDDLASFGL